MRTLVILAVLLFAGIGIAQSQVLPPTPSKASHKPEVNLAQHNETPAKDQRGTESSPVFIKVIPPSIVEPQPAPEAQSQNDHSSPEWALVYVTSVLVAFTAGLMCYTALLWRETQNLARDAKQAATQQATDMQTSLDTAKQSANASTAMVATMERNARTELRAYVGVDHVHIENGNGGSHRGIFVIKNFGKTMAKSTKIRINGTMIIGSPITEFPLGEGDIKSKTVAMPSESLSGIEQPINPTKDRDSHIYVWGQIDYEDVFGVPHWTKFRFVDYRKTFAANGLQTGWAVKTCDEGNDADDN